VIKPTDLPPTQYLVMEVLAARYRLGHQAWTFPRVLRPAMNALEEKRLIWWKSGTAPASILAGLTTTGREHSLMPGYVPPITPPQ
jgi:hypothetical protein